MKQKETKMSANHLNNEQMKENQKKYESPCLIQLGKMQKVTLGKAGSNFDGAQVGEEP